MSRGDRCESRDKVIMCVVAVSRGVSRAAGVCVCVCVAGGVSLAVCVRVTWVAVSRCAAVCRGVCPVCVLCRGVCVALSAVSRCVACRRVAMSRGVSRGEPVCRGDVCVAMCRGVCRGVSR